MAWLASGGRLPFGPKPTAPQINYGGPPLTQGLVFDANYFVAGGTVHSDLTLAAKGTFTGTTPGIGPYGGERTFAANATDVDSYTVGASVESLANLTIEMLLMMTGTNNNGNQFFTKGTNYSGSGHGYAGAGWFGSGLNNNFYHGNDFSSSAANEWYTNNSFAANQWWHVVITQNVPNAPMIYVNGVEQALTQDNTGVGSVVADNSTLLVGNTSAYTQGGAGGIISHCRIWNRILSQIEVQALYQNPWQIYRDPPLSGAYLGSASFNIYADSYGPAESLSAEKRDYSLIAVEIEGAFKIDSFIPLEFKGTGGAQTVDSKMPLDFITGVTEPRPNGFRVEPNNFFITDDSGNRLIPDPSIGTMSVEVMRLFAPDNIVMPAEHLGASSNSLPIKVELIGTMQPDNTPMPAEHLAAIIHDNAIPLWFLGGIGPSWKIPLDFNGTILGTPSVDNKMPLEILAHIQAPRENGIRLEPNNYFLVTDSGNRIVLDGRGTIPIGDWFSHVYRDSPPPIDHIAWVRLDSLVTFETGVSHLTILSPAIPLEHLISVPNLFIVPMDDIAPMRQASLVLVDHRATVQRDSGKIPAETLWASFAQASAAVEHLSSIISNSNILMELHGFILHDWPISLEHTMRASRDSPMPVEETIRVTKDSHIPMDDIAPLRADSRTWAEWATRISPADFLAVFEFKSTLEQNTPAVHAEHTVDVKANTAQPAEHLLGIASTPRIPMQTLAMLLRDSVIWIDPHGAVLVDMGHEIPVEFGSARLVAAVMPLEHQGGVGPSAHIPVEPLGSVAEFPPQPVEHKAAIMDQAAAHIEILSDISDLSKIPADYLGILGRSATVVIDFRTALERDSAIVAELLASLRQDSAALLEHLGTVLGLTRSGLAYSGSIQANAGLPAEFKASLAASAAGALEHLASVRADAGLKPEWRGAIRIDMPIPVEVKAALLRDGLPMAVEITIDVHRDESEPLFFYGYALIQETQLIGTDEVPSLTATDGVITLQGTQATVLLVGGVGSDGGDSN